MLSTRKLMKNQAEQVSRMLYRLSATFVQLVEYEFQKWMYCSMAYCIVPVFINLICNDISNLVQMTSLVQIRFVPYLVLITIATVWLVLKYQIKDRHLTTPSHPTPPPSPLSIVSIETPIETAAEPLQELLVEISKNLDRIGEKIDMGCSRCKSEYTIQDPVLKASSPSTRMERISSSQVQARAVVNDAHAIHIDDDYKGLGTGLESVILLNVSKIHHDKKWEDMRASFSWKFDQLLERLETKCCKCKAGEILDRAQESFKIKSTIAINGEKDFTDFQQESHADFVLKSSRYPPYSLHHRPFLHG